MNVLLRRSAALVLVAALAGCAGPAPTQLPSTPAPTVAASTAPQGTDSASPIPATAQPAEGTWSVTGSMAVARKRHTATLLPNGKVLVAGGVDSNDDDTNKALASAELFDPKTGTWSKTGSMLHPRAWHTATLLDSGLVLVVGGQCPGRTTPGCLSDDDPGWDPTGAMPDAELYNPKTGKWTEAGRMTSPRFLHTATVLADGKVLVAGAELAPDRILASTELYDPATGKWTATGSMGTARWQQFAVALPDGGALVAGGAGPISPTAHGVLSSVEEWSPQTGTWRSGPPLLVPRAQGAAAVLLPTGNVLFAGGDGGGDQMLATAELYDQLAGSMSTAAMSTKRVEFGWALLPGDRLLVAGGFDVPGTGMLLASAEIYDVSASTWHSAGAMDLGRFECEATLLNDGRVLVSGGDGIDPDAPPYSDNVSASAEIYTP